ncbi:MAG: tetratricopeptide repeat protein, partial [Cyanobacteria bacterium J06592_8]
MGASRNAGFQVDFPSNLGGQRGAQTSGNEEKQRAKPYENLGQRGITERENFIGRDQQLAELHQLLQQNNQVAITAAVVGMGGVGKTELAIQYARQHLNEIYKGGVCFISGGSFIFEVMQFARPRFFPKMDFTGFSEAEQLTYCWQHWAEGEVLLIVDDVTAYKQQVQPYLPGNPRFKVLITTREQIPNVTPLNLEVLHPDDALKLLESIIGDRIKAEPETAEELCKWLGYLPLGLELVGRYLADEEDLCLAKMLQRLQRKRLKHSSLQNEDNTAETAELGVAAAFELSWERLQKQPETQQLGCLLSLFSPDAILWDLVELVYKYWQGEDIDLEDIEDSRRKLVKLSLFQRTKEKTYRLHQLLREFFRDKLEEQKDAAAMKQAFVTTMVNIAADIPQNITTQQVKQVEPAIKHIEEVANTFSELVSDEDLITPFTRLGRFYQGQTLYSEAELWLKKGVEITNSRLGEEHPFVAASLNNLAGLYSSQGLYSKAEPLYQQALEMTQRLFKTDHPDVATNLNNLASLYSSQGRNSEAEPLWQQALAMYQRLFDGDHPYVALSLNNLAYLYNSQGRYKEAEPLYQQALEMTQRLFEGDHPDVARSLNNLAELYNSQGRYSQAEPLCQQALEMRQRLFEGDHSHVADSLNNLAALYKSQGCYKEAEPLYQKALEMKQRLFEGDHPNVALSLNNLAELYNSQGRNNEAEPLYQQALEMTQRLFEGD